MEGSGYDTSDDGPAEWAVWMSWLACVSKGGGSDNSKDKFLHCTCERSYKNGHLC